MIPLEERSVLAEKMVSLRFACGFTQQQMAEQLCIHRTTYTKYETDKVRPDQNCLERFAHICCVPIDYLLSPNRDPIPDDCLHEDGVVIGVHPHEYTMLMRYRKLPTQEQQKLLLVLEKLIRDLEKESADEPGK